VCVKKYAGRLDFLWEIVRFFLEQGCQILLGATYQSGENVPNGHKIYHLAIKYTKWPLKTTSFFARPFKDWYFRFL
jgi:hypothetical protein